MGQNDSFHVWKVAALFLIKNYLWKHFFFSFHSNLTIKHKVVQKFPKFHQEILTRWGKFLSSPLKVSSAIASQFIWYDEYIKIDNNTIHNHHLSKKKT